MSKFMDGDRICRSGGEGLRLGTVVGSKADGHVLVQIDGENRQRLFPEAELELAFEKYVREADAREERKRPRRKPAWARGDT